MKEKDSYGCEVCRYYALEQGDTLYRFTSWDGGVGYDYINNIRYCPVCGKELPREGAKTEEDSEPWLCLSCRHYPPSSTDGKPCSQCNPSEVWHSCYDPVEERET